MSSPSSSHKKSKNCCPPQAETKKPSRSSGESTSPLRKTEIQVLQKQVTDLLSKDPSKAAKILTEWLGKPASRSKKKSA